MKVTAPSQIREPEDLAFLSTAHRARKELEIDLSKVEWISPLGVVAVLTTCLRASGAALAATVDPPRNDDVSAYLFQIGFAAELERNGWTGPDASGASGVAAIGPHLPVSRLTTEMEVEAAAEVLRQALVQTKLAGGLSEDLGTIATELTANAREHGEDCYAVVQVHTGTRSGTPGVQIAVADFGVGFAKTLQEHHGDMADSDAILRGFEAGVSGTGDPYRGNGLAYIAEAVDKYRDNVLHVVSQDGYVVRRAGRFQVIEGLAFPGTLASAYLPVPSGSL